MIPFVHAFLKRKHPSTTNDFFLGNLLIRNFKYGIGYTFIAFAIFTISPFSIIYAQGEDPSASSDGSSFSSDGSSSSGDGSSAPPEETSTSGEETSASNEEAPKALTAVPPQADYTNFAQKGAYENENWFSEVPQWHYYDMFGNKILDGFYLYGLSKDGNDIGTGQSNLALHPFLRTWFDGVVQIADLHEDGGIMALIGNRIKSEFTPFTLNQSLFVGSRFDVFYKQQSLTFLTNRISNTGMNGMVTTASTAVPNADWITGAHAKRKIGEVAEIGGTWVNVHHENSKVSDNPFSGVDSDTLTKGTHNGLTLFGLNANLKIPKLQMYGEYAHSQEFLDGKFKPKAGLIATLNGHFDILDSWRVGSEMYSIGSRFQTNFTCPAHINGDAEVGKYQYSLVEDNDDKDEFPENGRSKYLNYTNKDPILGQGDPDGTIPFNWDKNKNGKWDYEEDFLSYDADPPESQILFDRNNNGTPDEIEDDAYPDYPYVPSYYLPGEKYWRFNDIDNKWENKWADGLTIQKGLAGYHLFTRFGILSDLELTVGGIFDRSQEKTFQPYYENGKQITEEYKAENASNIYLLAHFKKDMGRDVFLTLDNYFRKVRDNIPNHTQGFVIDPGTEAVSFYTIVDELDNRDMFADAIRAEFSLFKNRGFNYSLAGKLEFEKHFPHLEYNYHDISITTLNLVNKCHYTILLPFFKDMFLIPKYKNIWEIYGYGPKADSLDPLFDASLNSRLDAKYRRNSMINAAYLLLEWKMSEKTGFTTGLQLKQFSDFINSKESYVQPCFRIQLMIKDRYAGMVLVLTTGFSQFGYFYANNMIEHNPLNNPNRVVKNIVGHEFFIKIHSGF